MRLIFDLRLAPTGEVDDPNIRRLNIEGIAADPIGAVRSVWARRYEETVVVLDGLPLSGVQAGIQALASLARSPRFTTHTNGDSVSIGRAGFLTRALAQMAIKVPQEVWSTLRINNLANRIGETRFQLPRQVRELSRAIYLRGDPTLRWKGAFVGGSATHTTGVINGLRGNGVDITVYAPEPIPGIGATRTVTVTPNRILHLAHWMTATAYSREIVKKASHEQADFIYQRYALGSYAGLDLARKLDVPLILEFNGSEIWAQNAWGESKLRYVNSLTGIERRNLMDASLIVVVSEVLREQLIDQGVEPDRVLTNPNGVDVQGLARFREASPAEWRARRGEPEAPTIGFIGSFGLWHGVKLLPAMIESVKKTRPDARWMIVGDGSLFDEIKSEIDRRGLTGQVTLTGILEHDDAVEYLAASDICVSPHVPNEDGSRFFGSPTKLFEYMGLGKPIVASDLEQIGEVIEHERTGLLCTPGDVEQQSTAVVRLLNDTPLARRLGEAALKEAEANYSWDAHVRRTLNAIQNVPEGKPGPSHSTHI